LDPQTQLERKSCGNEKNKKEKKEEEETNREESAGSMTIWYVPQCVCVCVWSDGAKPEMGFFSFLLEKKRAKNQRTKPTPRTATKKKM
jgi:hypothetical protein